MCAYLNHAPPPPIAAVTTSRQPRIPERIRWTVECLDLAPTDRVLEIGCGPGHAVSLVAGRLTAGTITAIDRSATMVARARAWNAAALASGRAVVERGTLEALDGPPRFDVAFAVNVNAFWVSPAPAFAAVRRVLERDGALHLAWEPPAGRSVRELRERLERIVAAHHFAVSAVHEAAFATGRGLCLVARPG